LSLLWRRSRHDFDYGSFASSFSGLLCRFCGSFGGLVGFLCLFLRGLCRALLRGPSFVNCDRVANLNFLDRLGAFGRLF
jgi:hypothetical protein